MHTDTAINERIYCYGSLYSVPKEASGASVVMPLPTEEEHMAAISARVRSMLGLGIVTILKCSGLKSGPSAGAGIAQSPMMGFNPQNGCVTGCILTKSGIQSMETTLGAGMESTECEELSKVLHDPISYLKPDYQEFLMRYVAGGTLHAFAPRIPSWCAGQTRMLVST